MLVCACCALQRSAPTKRSLAGAASAHAFAALLCSRGSALQRGMPTECALAGAALCMRARLCSATRRAENNHLPPCCPHRCHEGYKVNAFPGSMKVMQDLTLDYLNTQAAEQCNAQLESIATQVAFMSQRNMFKYVRFYLCRFNEEKQASIL